MTLQAILLLLALVLLGSIPAVASAKTENSGGAPKITAQQAAPSVSLAATTGVQVRLNSPVPVTATFSEPVSGFTVGDITVGNGIAGSFSGSDGDPVYTFSVTPESLGEVTVDIAADVAEDAEGAGNTAAQQLSLGLPYDFDGSRGISRTEVIAAIVDYFAEKITRAQTIEVIVLYFSTPTEPEPGPGPQPGPGSIESDRTALVAFYNATNGPNWANDSGWLSDTPLGQWYGIDTDSNGRVVGVDLRENSLAGPISAELGNLSSLLWLFLNNDAHTCVGGCRATSPTANRLTGEIPPELGQLTNLERLFLSLNPLTGEIPSELAALVKLKELGFWISQLDGEIPPWLGDLANLETLHLAVNDFSGPIPEGLGNLSNLYHLNLSVNELTGTIPASLGNLTGLTHLGLNSNRLTGTIPASLGNLANLDSMYISGNELSGCIPAGLRGVPENDFSALPFCSQ